MSMGYYAQPLAPPPRSAHAAAKAPVTNANPTNPETNPAYPQAHDQPELPAGNETWSTNSSEERERIRDFWLALTEEERRDLVKVKKDSVLSKMKKEQQKHWCSCAVCSKKRNAIEEELEVLYDAYYEDLEQYVLYQQLYLSNPTLPAPPGPGPFPGSIVVARYGIVIAGNPPLHRKAKNERRKSRMEVPLPPAVGVHGNNVARGEHGEREGANKKGRIAAGLARALWVACHLQRGVRQDDLEMDVKNPK
ncbi:salt tolerance down-regulator-domain-containing protein [Mycena rosella]|uniref:Stress response protein NST1 n=1 Tax=Mycena rosella TaxID=1033263 RepID=A0AAD7GRW0_MYCRO|nr:salt tolerance down-regulator-domain-containing protein [Mycena rosella]